MPETSKTAAKDQIPLAAANNPRCKAEGDCRFFHAMMETYTLIIVEINNIMLMKVN